MRRLRPPSSPAAATHQHGRHGDRGPRWQDTLWHPGIPNVEDVIRGREARRQVLLAGRACLLGQAQLQLLQHRGRTQLRAPSGTPCARRALDRFLRDGAQQFHIRLQPTDNQRSSPILGLGWRPKGDPLLRSPSSPTGIAHPRPRRTCKPSAAMQQMQRHAHGGGTSMGRAGRPARAIAVRPVAMFTGLFGGQQPKEPEATVAPPTVPAPKLPAPKLAVGGSRARSTAGLGSPRCAAHEAVTLTLPVEPVLGWVGPVLAWDGNLCVG
jgi:hypothetical protein